MTNFVQWVCILLSLNTCGSFYIQSIPIFGIKHNLQNIDATSCMKINPHACPKSIGIPNRLRGGGLSMKSNHDSIPTGNSAHNFGPATARDDLVHGSFRPGFSEATESRGAVNDDDVLIWAKFMQSQGVKRVICLLNDDELQFYRCAVRSTNGP
jgi:hypothetical protein